MDLYTDCHGLGMTRSDGVDQPSFVFVVTRQPCSLSFSLPEPSDPPSSSWAGSTVEMCISFMDFDLVRMVRSVETKRMRGTKERNRMTGRIHIRILSQHTLQNRETLTISQHPLKGRET